MALEIKKITDDWKVDQPKYDELGKLIVAYIKSTISEYEILPEISYRTKDLLSIVKKIKKKQLDKEYSYSHLKDKLGIRIICTFQEDMEKIDEFLKQNFCRVQPEYKKETLDFNQLDYISNHYDASIKCSLNEFKQYSNSEYENFIFEIQVRTLNQHAWSNAAHSLSYKQDIELEISLKRKIYRLLSLYEIADDEISAVNKILQENPVNSEHGLLRKLEGKIYKYAKVDYDKETALTNIKTLLSFFSEKEKEKIFKEIEIFIQENSEKIIRIFDENRIRYFEIPFLTQPEVFIVWMALEKFSFSVEDNWAIEFDIDELEQIKVLWGLNY